MLVSDGGTGFGVTMDDHLDFSHSSVSGSMQAPVQALEKGR